jgi:hypothetical protein
VKPFGFAGTRHHSGKTPPTLPMLRRVSKSKGKGWIGGRDGGESGAQKPLNPLTPREALNQDLKPVLALRDRASDLFKKRKLQALFKAISAVRTKANAAVPAAADLQQSPQPQSKRRIKKPRPGA